MAMDDVRGQVDAVERGVGQVRPVDVDVPVARLVADRASLQPRIRLEQRDVLRVQVDLPVGDMQPAQYLFAWPFLDLVPIEVQPQDVLDDPVDRNGEADRDTQRRSRFWVACAWSCCLVRAWS